MGRAEGSWHRELWDGRVVSVVEALVMVQCSVLVVGGGCTESGGVEGSVCRVLGTCRGCMGPVASAGRTSVDVGVGASLGLADGFCCLGDMLGVGWGCWHGCEGWGSIEWRGFGKLVPLLASEDVSLVV